MTEATIRSLHVYPVKGCRGIDLESSRVMTEGLRYDREWMVVDPNGRFLTQREVPGMARIGTRLDGEFLTLSMLGQGSTQVPLRYRDGPIKKVVCWRFTTEALDCGDDAADFLSSCMGTVVRLVRFPRNAQRDCNPDWTPGVAAHTKFSDGYPLLVLGSASVDDLRARMGISEISLPLDRFRANIVLDGLGAYEEDFVARFGDGDLQLKPVKPCARCTVPSVDQTSGVEGSMSPLDALNTYRLNPKVGGATLGMNAVVAAGAGGTLSRGDRLAVEFGF